MAYDKADPRSNLYTAKRDESGVSTWPASYGLYYQEDPVDTDAKGKSWYTRSQHLLVNYIESQPGATFSRKGQTDEYMIVVPDDETPWEATAKGESVSGNGWDCVIVPPGDSEIRLPKGGRVVRLFSTQSPDLNGKCSNAETYKTPDPAVAPWKAWPAPPSGYKLRVYPLARTRTGGMMGGIYRCTTIMLNFPPPGGGPRDLTKMSPHSHYDFDQCSLVLNGSFKHNMRWPWGLNKNEWRPDEAPITEAPSATMIPARVIHTSESLHKTNNRMADIFAPPRLDFSLQKGWVKNADEYPLPEEAEAVTR